MSKSATEQPLLLQVRMAFMAQGTSLHRWCIAEGVDRSYAAKAVTGAYTFPAAKLLRNRILAACGIPAPKATRRKSA